MYISIFFNTFKLLIRYSVLYMPVAFVPNDTISFAHTANTRVVVRVDRKLLLQINPSMELLTETDSFTRIIRKGRPALAHLHREVSNALFGTDLSRASADLAWPKRTTSPSETVKNGYVGFYYNYRVAIGDMNPAVLELTSGEELHGNVVMFDAEQLDGDRRELANLMVNEAEASHTS